MLQKSRVWGSNFEVLSEKVKKESDGGNGARAARLLHCGLKRFRQVPSSGVHAEAPNSRRDSRCARAPVWSKIFRFFFDFFSIDFVSLFTARVAVDAKGQFENADRSR